MKTEYEYRRELMTATQNGDTERIQDLKDILAGIAIEPTCFTDLLIATDNNLRVIQTDYTRQFRETFCK